MGKRLQACGMTPLMNMTSFILTYLVARQAA